MDVLLPNRARWPNQCICCSGPPETVGVVKKVIRENAGLNRVRQTTITREVPYCNVCLQHVGKSKPKFESFWNLWTVLGLGLLALICFPLLLAVPFYVRSRNAVAEEELQVKIEAAQAGVRPECCANPFAPFRIKGQFVADIVNEAFAKEFLDLNPSKHTHDLALRKGLVLESCDADKMNQIKLIKLLIAHCGLTLQTGKAAVDDCMAGNKVPLKIVANDAGKFIRHAKEIGAKIGFGA